MSVRAMIEVKLDLSTMKYLVRRVAGVAERNDVSLPEKAVVFQITNADAEDLAHKILNLVPSGQIEIVS